MPEVPEPTSPENETPAPPTPSVYCFISDERICGPDCIAYMSQPADGNHLDPQARHCVVLVSGERLARHAAIGIKVISDAVAFAKQVNADAKRTAQTPPTPPR